MQRHVLLGALVVLVFGDSTVAIAQPSESGDSGTDYEQMLDTYEDLYPEDYDPDADYYDYEDPSSTIWEVTVQAGLFDRTTSEIGAPLLDYGYASSAGLATGAQTRLLHAENDWFAHGAGLRFVHHAVHGLDFTGGTGFHWYQFDLGYTTRFTFPCMSSDDFAVGASGSIGVTGAYADAQRGNGPDDANANVRTAAADELDHAALGAFLSASLDFRFGALAVGLVLDMREFGTVTDAPTGRTFAKSVMLQTGFSIE